MNRLVLTRVPGTYPVQAYPYPVRPPLYRTGYGLGGLKGGTGYGTGTGAEDHSERLWSTCCVKGSGHAVA